MTADDVEQPPDVLAEMFNGAWLDTQEFPPLEYAVPGIIPEGFGLLVSPPKAGKSWLVCGIGLACATGGLALGRIHVDKRPVLYLALEDGKRRLQSRSRRIMCGQPIPAGIHFITKAKPAESPTFFAHRIWRQTCCTGVDVTVKHGRSRYLAGCRCEVCTTAAREYQRAYYRRRRGLFPDEKPALSNGPVVASDGPVVEGVREEVAAARAAVDRPGLAAVALALAAILDNPKHVPTQPAAARQLVAILDQLSKRTHRRGTLAVVRAMSSEDSPQARS